MDITPSHIIQYLYCPRFTYFEHILKIPQYEDKYYKVKKGREVHNTKALQNIDYKRQRIGVIDKQIKVYLRKDPLRGEVDEVLLLSDGSMAPLDYKFAEYKDKVYDTYKTQLICYAIMIEANFDKPVNKAYLVYTRSKNKLIEIEITDQAKRKVETDIIQMSQIIEDHKYPKATIYKKRCITCTYRNICTK